MPSTAAPAAGADAAPPAASAAATPPADKKATVPSDIRRRVLGAREPTPDEIAAKAKADADAKAKAEADAKADADKKAAEAAAAAAATAKPDAEQPKPRVKKAPKAAPPLPDAPAPAPAAATPPASAPTPTPKPTVSPEVEREIELARFAEKKGGDRYAGFAAKVEEFYAARDDLIAAKAKELGGQTSPDFRDWIESDEFKGWVEKHKPSYARGDYRRLQEDMIVDRAREEARKEADKAREEAERRVREVELRPKLERATDSLLRTTILVDTSEEKDPALEEFVKDPAKFGDEYPEEAQIIASESAAAVALIEEAYKIEHDVVAFDKAKPLHTRLNKMLVAYNSNMRTKHPNGLEMQDGKILVDAKTYEERKLDRDPRYRIFNADEIAGMLAAEANARLLERLKRRREGVTKSIYLRRPAGADATTSPPAQVTTPATDEHEAPSGRVSSAPGASAAPAETKGLGRRYA